MEWQKQEIYYGQKHRVVAVIGDGALTGGMALEALNDAGSSKTKMIVILNDNEMSIAKNVGGMASFLSKLRTKKWYTKTNIHVKNVLNKVPVIGNRTVRFVQKFKRIIKQAFIQKMFFEDIGFTYLGPVDGHDIEKLESIISMADTIDAPVLIHVITKKGKGYKIAEANPDKYHSTSSFDIATGNKLKQGSKDYSAVFGNKLCRLAEDNSKIVAITASMREGTGLNEFAEKFPKRFYDVGIAEQHALGFAAGLAKAGLRPVIPLYSSFLQRGYDQVLHDICIQSLPVVICIDRAGIVGNDGETHQGVFDLSFLNTIPNLKIAAPKDFKELEDMLEFAIKQDYPIAIRYPRGGEASIQFSKHDEIKQGKAEVLKQGNDVIFFAIGKMVATALNVANILEKENIAVKVINVRWLNELDKQIIVESSKNKDIVYTIEDNIITGGLGSSVLEVLNANNIKCKVEMFGYPKEFIKHATPAQIEQMYGLDVETIVNRIRKDVLCRK